MAFVDHEGAFDPVKTSAAMRRLSRQSFDEPLIKVPKDINNGSMAPVKLHKRTINSHLAKVSDKSHSFSKIIHGLCRGNIQEARLRKHGNGINGDSQML